MPRHRAPPSTNSPVSTHEVHADPRHRRRRLAGRLAAKVSHDLQVPLGTVIIGPGLEVTDIYYDWARGREVDEDALLVRPDKFIGWRSATLPDDPEQALRTALSSLLGR